MATLRFPALSGYRSRLGPLRIGHVLFILLYLVAFAFGASTIPRGGVSRNAKFQQPLSQGQTPIAAPANQEMIKSNSGPEPSSSSPNNGFENSQTLQELIRALEVLQKDYFEVWQGVWPTTIDWTSAVVGTYVSAALGSLSASFSVPISPADSGSALDKAAENLINKFYSQLVSSYFGQDDFALRQEAYDDMLWVVLGWIESIKFITIHSALHYKSHDGSPWYGTQWIPAFAHRARIFWELASHGWDTSLCDGGMVWSPYLEPYKNAITNELFITASISMYLYFPGDDNSSPFGFGDPQRPILAPPHDRKYLTAAIKAYDWLAGSNMTNEKGLYVDGFHISGWTWPGRGKNHSQSNTECDARNEMVYTYNQGVLLSGQRGLFEATGRKRYLDDGHSLIESVIAATGYDLELDRVEPEFDDIPGDGRRIRRLGRWRGLGRSGILEDACDSSGRCSQDGQTFKGIFFQHFTLFCAQLPVHVLAFERDTVDAKDYGALQNWHQEMCARYAGWVAHNAHAALRSRDENGRFGMWWDAPQDREYGFVPDLEDHEALVVLPPQAVDYRNEGVLKIKHRKSQPSRSSREHFVDVDEDAVLSERDLGLYDLNDRGRGRTAETQGGGLSVLRALWELVDRRRAF